MCVCSSIVIEDIELGDDKSVVDEDPRIQNEDVCVGTDSSVIKDGEESDVDCCSAIIRHVKPWTTYYHSLIFFEQSDSTFTLTSSQW